MRRVLKNSTAALLSLSFLFSPLPPAKACAPDLAYAILINGNHPDLPLSLFAGGDIGVIQPGWAKSYLVVAYRYLSGKPLSKLEQDSVVRLWHQRIEAGSNFTTVNFPHYKDDYLTVRAKAIGADIKKNPEIYWKMDSYCYQKSVSDSAFVLAKETLSSILTKYPAKSQQVVDWVKAQDGIFGIGTEKTLIPVALAKSADPSLQAARIYQMGAANFYLKNFDKATSLFQQVGDGPTPKLKIIASYMVLRSKSNQILRGDGSGDAEAVSAELQKAADKAGKVEEREDILDLQRPISYLNLSQEDVAEKMATSVMSGDSKRFGRDVGDLTFILDGNYPLSGLNVQGTSNSSGSTKTDDSKSESSVENNLSKTSDLADFVLNMQKSIYTDESYSDEDRAKGKQENQLAAKHALEMWNKTKSAPWLVAALSSANLRLQDNKDLLEAAMHCPQTSPAYFTCRFYIVDSLLASGKREEARKMLQSILASGELPPTSRNLFLSQMSSASETLGDYFKYSVLNPPEILGGPNDLVSQKFSKLEEAKNFQTETPALDPEMATDLNRNAPFSSWIKFAQSENIPPKFKPIIVRTAWTRAQLLQKNDDAAKLQQVMATTNPTLAGAVAKIKNAPEGPARRFAVASLILRNFGMSPYLQGGAERHAAAINVFDWYNNNFWVPLPINESKSDESRSYSYNDSTGYVGDDCVHDKVKSYWKPGISRFLNSAEKKVAETERGVIIKNHPSRFLGDAVLDWAKTHPGDPEVPELLYHVVRLPKWTEVTPVGSEYSKKAYFVLHKNYPGNQWTKKAVCYY